MWEISWAIFRFRLNGAGIKPAKLDWKQKDLLWIQVNRTRRSPFIIAYSKVHWFSSDSFEAKLVSPLYMLYTLYSKRKEPVQRWTYSYSMFYKVIPADILRDELRMRAMSKMSASIISQNTENIEYWRGLLFRLN